MASLPPVGTQRVINDVVSTLSANSDVPYRATLAEAVAEFAVGYYFKTDDKAGAGPHPGELWIYQRAAGAPGYVAQINATASTVEINAAIAEVNAAAANALNYGNAEIRSNFAAADAETWAVDAWVQITSNDTGTHASKTGDFGASGGQTPNSGLFQEVVSIGLVRRAALESTLAAAQAVIATTQAGISTTKAGEAGQAAITANANVSRGLRRAEGEDSNLFNKEASGIALNTLLIKATGATTTAGGTGYNTSDFCLVEAGRTIINTRQIGFAGSGVYGLAWFDANGAFLSGLPASGSLPIPPFTPMDAPANAVSYRFCARVSNGDWDEMQLTYGSTAPASRRTFKKLDRILGRKESLVGMAQRQRSKVDYANPEDYIWGAYRTTTNAFTYDVNFATSNRIAGYPGMQVASSLTISGIVGVAFYDIDGNFLYTGNQGIAGSITNGTNQLVLTAGDGYAPAKGTPVSGSGVPAGTYVIDRSAPRTPCTVTISANATADGTGTYSFQGTRSYVPITFPEEACYAEFPLTRGSLPWVQLLSDAPQRGDMFRGVRHDVFAALPLAGQETMFEGDSIMQSSNAGTGQPSAIPPGVSATVGVLQHMLQVWTQADVTAYRGSAGKQIYQALSAYGPFPALTAGDFASAALTGSVTIDTTTLSVTVGTPVAGRRVNGPGLPEQTYIVSVSGSDGAYTCVLSRKAFATRSGAYSTPPLRNYIDENLTNTWGLATATPNARANSTVQLGVLGDTWVPTLGSVTFTSGSKAVTLGTPTIGAWANGMPICGSGGAKVPAGTTLVDLGGGSWELSVPAIASGTVTSRGGSFYGDLYDIHVRKIAAWSPSTRQIKLGALRRFDCTATPANIGNADYRDGDPRNDLGAYLSDYNNAARAFCEYWGFTFIDTFNKFNVNSLSSVGRYDAANLHPNTIFVFEAYGPFLAGELNKLVPTIRY